MANHVTRLLGGENMPYLVQINKRLNCDLIKKMNGFHEEIQMEMIHKFLVEKLDGIRDNPMFNKFRKFSFGGRDLGLIEFNGEGHVISITIQYWDENNDEIYVGIIEDFTLKFIPKLFKCIDHNLTSKFKCAIIADIEKGLNNLSGISVYKIDEKTYEKYYGRKVDLLSMECINIELSIQ